MTEEPQIHIGYAGLVTRAVALGLDALVINGIAVITGALVNLIASFFGHAGPHQPPRGAAWRGRVDRVVGALLHDLLEPSRVRRLETG